METPSSITENEINTYLSEIRHQLSFSHSAKEISSIMQMLENSIDDFLSEHPAATINDLKKHFGDIDDLKEMFFSCTEPKTLEHLLDISQNKKKYIIIFFVFVAIIFLIFIGFKIKFYYDLEKSIPAYEIIRIE